MLLCAGIGALICGALSAAVFVIGAVTDGTRFSEAVAFGLVAGSVAAFCGALIGLGVALADLDPLTGGLAGLLATLGAVAFYVMGFGRASQIGYYVSESAIIVAVLAVPAVLAGVFTALIKNRLR